MLFGIDKAIGNVVSTATGGEKGEKTRARTHLNTDQTLTTFSVVVPLVLILFVRTFTANTFLAPSLLCSMFQYTYTQPVIDPVTNQTIDYKEQVYKSSNANRFFFNNYCWETLTHHVLDEDQPIYPVSKETVDLTFHKLYPYYMFCSILLLAMPMIAWTNYAEKNVQEQTQYLFSGIEEAMHMAVAQISEMIEDNSVFIESKKTRHVEKAGPDGQRLTTIQTVEKDVKSSEEIYNLFDKKFRNRQEGLNTKFNAVKEFLYSELMTSNIVKGFLLYRLANMSALVVVNVLLWKYTLWNQQSEFNCKVPMSAGNVMESEKIEEIVVCTISGVTVLGDDPFTSPKSVGRST